MLISTQNSLPGMFILLFTILTWILFFSIYFSNKHNRLNCWAFLAGMCFSSGILKEYLYFSVVPSLITAYPQVDLDFYTQVYSVMTAILYYFSMPCVMIMAFYYSGIDKKLKPAAFRLLQCLAFLPPPLFGIFIPYWETRYYQVYVFPYYLTVSVYNWVYGIIITILILRTLYRERLHYNFKQRKMVAVNALLPIWYWLITAFLIHCLRISSLFKLWQGNLFIIIFLLLYYFYNVFRDGIWGMRLTKEHYDWMSDTQLVQNNTAYIEHALKNELIKIEWCTDRLSEHFHTQPKELDIIAHSTGHLKEFLNKSRLMSAEISLNPTTFPIKPVLERCTRECLTDQNAGISFDIDCPEEALITCDRDHLIEVINNIINNAVDAVSCRTDGSVSIHYTCPSRRNYTILSITDNGAGMSKAEQLQVFRPYYTTRTASSKHFGLGLYYCYHVMDKLKGRIRVRSLPGKGTTFFLYFPMTHARRIEKTE